MPKASDIQKGAVVRFRDQVCAVRKREVQLPSSRGSNTLYKLRLQDVQTGQNIDHTFKGDDQLESVEFLRRPVSYSYFDGEMHVFLDDEDYSQYLLSADDLADELPFLSEDATDLQVMIIEDQAVGIQLPNTMVMEIEETSPAIKGATVTKRTKPAMLAGGLEIQVPEYLSTGEKIKVNTENATFVSRA
ncbi:MAG: elongation factor P-like protein YeiP [Pseudomonadota bacterium]